MPNLKMSVEVTVAIVNYKTPELLENCLSSIFKHVRDVSFVVWVLDNASRDGSVELVRKKFPKVRLIANKQNSMAALGFNTILSQAKSPYCLITEPGVELMNNAVSPMIKFLKRHPKAAAVSTRQVDEVGSFDTTCSRFPTPIIEVFNSSIFSRFVKNKKLLSWWRYRGWKRDSVRRVEVASDIFMLAKTEVLTKVDYYDTNMDLFFIENDLCLKIRSAGYYVYHLGNVTVRHLRGRSTAKFKPSEMYKFYEHDMLYYYKKHFGFFWWLFLVLVFQSNRLYYFFARTK